MSGQETTLLFIASELFVLLALISFGRKSKERQAMYGRSNHEH